MPEKPPKPIVIQGYQGGITEGPFVDGFSDMRNVDIQTRPGSVRLNFALQSAIPAALSGTFTADPTTDVITTSVDFGLISTNQTVGVSFTTAGTLPTASGGNLTAGTTYYLVYQSANHYKLARDYALAIATTTIDITSAGVGTLNIATVNMGVPKYLVTDPTATTTPGGANAYWLQDSNGRIWYTASNSLQNWVLIIGNTLSSAHGNGLILFNNYLLVFRDAIIDTYNLTASLGAAASWNNGFKTIYSGTGSMDNTTINFLDHTPFYSSISGTVYWSEVKVAADGQAYIIGQVGLGSLLQATGQKFDPTSSSTYTFQTGLSASFALMLPPYHYITSIILVGSNLEIGTNQNIIYPWDTHSATYALPIIIPESGTNSMVNVGNYFYFSCGKRGNIYLFNGYTTQKIGKISPYLTNLTINTVNVGNMVKHNGKIYFAVSCKGCSGVWSLDPNTNVLTFENEVSLNTFGTSTALTTGVVYSLGSDQLVFGWYDTDSTTYGLDVSCSNGNYYQAGYNAYVETQFYNVGLPNNPRGLENFDITLGALLQSGHGVKIYSRGDTVSTYSATPDATFDFATFGAVDSIKLPFGKSFVNVQFRIYLTTGSSSNTTPQLNSIVII